MDEADRSTTSGVLASSITGAPHDRDSHSGSGRLEVRCPNCHTPIEVAVDTRLTDLTCGICGSHFSLVDQSQATRMAPPLSTMGRFELIERLGVGGFGSVWKARDRELDRTVAIKIPRQGGMTAEEQEKFFREARAAAQLRHPSIVSVHEVGRDGENVYIVSDFVRGVTLGDWLTGQKLTSREAAELCAKIADALHHAHEQGVVHRDLKPANIMIDGAGEPHLMDFGLARRDVGEVTVTLDGEVLGTPAYMSPEQALGEAHTADRRSDVYSLGVILFQLLTGELPFRGNARMIMHQVIHDEPPSPRKLNANVSDDLETITLKCLEKEPARRYSTAREMADDLRRFLAGEPIQARPISRSERAVRWVRRNPAVSALTAAVVLTLIAGTVVSAYFARDALRKAALALERESEATIARRDAEKRQREADEARRDAEQRQKEADFARQDAEQRQKEAEQARIEEARARGEAEDVTTFLVSALESADPRAGVNLTLAQLLDRIETGLGELNALSDQPLSEATLLRAIGVSRLSLGMAEEAVGPLLKAKQIQSEELGVNHPATLASMHNLASAYAAAGRFDDAISLFEQTLEAVRQVQGTNDHKLATTIGSLGNAYLAAGRAEEAIPLLENTVSIYERILEVGDPGTLGAKTNLAAAYADVGRRDEAIKILEENLAVMRPRLGTRHPYTLNTMQLLGNVYAMEGRGKEAVRLLEESVAERRKALGPNHPDTIRAMTDLSLLYASSGRWDQTMRLAWEAMAPGGKLGHTPEDPLIALTSRALEHHRAGQFDKAIPLFEEAFAEYRRQFGANDLNTVAAMSNLANAYHAAGRLDNAIPLQQEALALVQEKLGPESSEALTATKNLVNMHHKKEQFEEAIRLSGQVLGAVQARLGPRHRETYRAMSDLAREYQSGGRLDDAYALYEQIIERQDKTLAVDDIELKWMHNLAHSFLKARRYSEAIRLFQVTRDARAKALGETHQDSLAWTICLAGTFLAADRVEEALPVLEQIVIARQHVLRPTDAVMIAAVKDLVPAYRMAGRLDSANGFFKEHLLTDGYFYQGLQIGTPEVVDAMIDAAMSDRHHAEAMPEPVDAVVLGELRLVGGDPKKAEAAIRAGIARAPAGYMHKSLGWCLLAQSKTDEAKAAFLEVLKDRRQEGGTFDLEGANYVEMTAAYFLDLISEEEYVAHTAGKSEQIARRRVELACFPWFYVGQRREIEGNREAAIVAYEKCVKLGDDETAHSNRALARWRLAKLREDAEGKTDLQQ